MPITTTEIFLLLQPGVRTRNYDFCAKIKVQNRRRLESKQHSRAKNDYCE